MNRLFAATLSLTLLAGVPALAAPPDGHDDRNQGRQGGGQHQGGQGGGTQPRPQGQPGGQRDHRQGGQPDRYRSQYDYRPGHPPANWDNRPHQYDPRDYHRNYHAEQRYHWNRYVRPHGWYDRRWYYGEHMPSFFWVRNYWITDFWMFGLAIPPYGCQWVRYNDDALLIDTRTGVIIQVVYGLFY